MASYTIIVNNVKKRISVDPDMPILWVLRDVLGLIGTKFGCGIGICGACTIHFKGKAVSSCTLSVKSVLDGEITTIEGLSETGNHPVQQAWMDMDAPQCGYCQPGQIMSAAELLSKKVNPSDHDINQAMSRNICRCGTYMRMRKAIKLAAKNLHQ